ncbi:MAG TPA: YcxB family protein [Pyrinomonadaceae bacterium]|jgi:hypothetical protein
MESVSLHFKLSEPEYMAGARLLTFPNAAAKARVAAGAFIYALCAALLVLAYSGTLFAAGITGLVALIALPLALHLSRTRLMRRCYRGDQKFRHGVTLTFTDAYVQVQADQIDSKFGWKLYTDVLEGADNYVLVYGRDVRMMTIVPKRAFKSKQQERAFRALLATHFDRPLSAPQLDDGAAVEQDYQPASFQPPDWR